MNRTDLIEELTAIAEQLKNGCQMNHCIINPPKGMAPNGGCRCSKDQIRIRLFRLVDDISDITPENWKMAGNQ